MCINPFQDQYNYLDNAEHMEWQNTAKWHVSRILKQKSKQTHPPKKKIK